MDLVFLIVFGLVIFAIKLLPFALVFWIINSMLNDWIAESKRKQEYYSKLTK